ncbi:MAG: M1 family aminopeptidase [Vicinamibacteria bacterium]
MKVCFSSAGGKRDRSFAIRIAMAFAVAAAMLTNSSAQPSGDPALMDAVRKFETALRQKSVPAAIGVWHFAGPGNRAAEEGALRGVFSSEQVTLISEPPAFTPDGQTAVTLGTLTQISEPRGAVEQWSLLWKKRPEGWRIEGRQTFGGIDGLVHLLLQPKGFVANGQSIELEDFSLKMIDGTIFLNTPDAGPTSMVFVGNGHVTFKPRPRTERGQMQIFARSEVLEDKVTRAFLRLHPADLYRTLHPGTFTEDPKSAERLPRAMDYFDRHKTDAFVLDAAIAGAPWWLLPGLGDAAIAFETKRFRSLTLSLTSFEEEGVSLFNRSTQRQIAVYPRAASKSSSAGVQSPIDVLNHDLTMTLNPDTYDIVGRDTVTLDVRSAVTSFRFRLDNELRVRSVRSLEGGQHLFFRVRGQNSVLVSMGSLTGSLGKLNLVVDYAGQLPAGTVESEVIRVEQDLAADDPQTFFIDPALIYSRRNAFYPQLGDEDYSTSTLSVTVPSDWNVVAGGVRTEKTEKGQKTVSYHQAKDGKYIAFVAARLLPLANERTQALSFDAFGQARSRRDSARSVMALKSAAQFYTKLFGPMPYSPISLALVESAVPGGHSPPGLLVVQQRPPLMGGNLRDDPATFYDIPGFFLAHELAHQWWGHGVTPRSYRDRWVSEGFAQYAAALWTRESQGEETFNRVLKKMAGWSRRMTAVGPVDLGNRVGHIQNNAQAHRAVVYDKGALVLDMVRRLIGDDAFGRSFKRIQNENRFEKVDSETVRRAFEKEGSIDLDGLWETFVRNVTLPSVRIERRHATGTEIVVEGYDGPIPVVVRVGNTRVDLIVTGRMKVPGVTPGERVTLDPDGISLLTVAR